MAVRNRDEEGIRKEMEGEGKEWKGKVKGEEMQGGRDGGKRGEKQRRGRGRRGREEKEAKGEREDRKEEDYGGLVKGRE